MIAFNLNGEALRTEVDPAMPLLWVLRDELNLTGTKFGCGVSACGACTVLLDGQAVRTCVLPVSAVAGRRITTIELGRASDASKDSGEALDKVTADQRLILQTLQAAWIEEQVPQCGYCQSGMLMAATSLLSKHVAPTEQQINQAMSNLCRCGTYQRVRSAIDSAASKLAEKSA